MDLITYTIDDILYTISDIGNLQYIRYRYDSGVGYTTYNTRLVERFSITVILNHNSSIVYKPYKHSLLDCCFEIHSYITKKNIISIKRIYNIKNILYPQYKINELLFSEPITTHNEQARYIQRLHYTS